MIETLLSIAVASFLFIGGLLVFTKKKMYPGFSSKATQKAWRGELPKDTIRDLEKSIAQQAEEAAKAKV